MKFKGCCNVTHFIFTRVLSKLIVLVTGFIPVLYAAQLPPPTLISAASEELTAGGQPMCNRSIIYWSNPSQSAVSSYRIFINGLDANDRISYLGNGRAGATLYDTSTQTVQLASEDSGGEVGPLSNPLTVTTPHCNAPAEYKIAVLMATFADFAGVTMPNNQPWNLDVVKNRYGVFQTDIGGKFTIADWLTRVSYGKVAVTVDFFDEVTLPSTMNQYCNRTLPNYGTVLGYDCNTYQINQDAIAANGGKSRFSQYQVVAVLAKGLGTIGISGITLSAHDAHYRTYNPNGTPPYTALLHEFLHSFNLAHHAAFRVSEGCYYPKDLSDISKNCTWDRYGGSSIMGAGEELSPNAEELRRLGLLKKKNRVFVSPSSGNSIPVSLEPLMLKSDGIKQIQIQGKGPNWYPNTYVSLEYRRATGINYRPGMYDAIFINLRAGLQNKGNPDAFTYEIGYRLTMKNPVVNFPEWGFRLRLTKMTTTLANVTVEYI